MTKKTTESYIAVFKYIEDNLFKLKPANFMTDFEAGLRKAILICYPTIPLHGCWYHYCSAVRRKALHLGLFSLLRDDLSARAIYKKLLNLPLLPSDHIVPGFEIIKKE